MHRSPGPARPAQPLTHWALAGLAQVFSVYTSGVPAWLPAVRYVLVAAAGWYQVDCAAFVAAGIYSGLSVTDELCWWLETDVSIDRMQHNSQIL